MLISGCRYFRMIVLRWKSGSVSIIATVSVWATRIMTIFIGSRFISRILIIFIGSRLIARILTVFIIFTGILQQFLNSFRYRWRCWNVSSASDETLRSGRVGYRVLYVIRSRVRIRATRRLYTFFGCWPWLVDTVLGGCDTVRRFVTEMQIMNDLYAAKYGAVYLRKEEISSFECGIDLHLNGHFQVHR